MRAKLFLLILLFFCAHTFALSFKEPLPIDKAFIFSAQATSPTQVILTWKIAPHYYLYRDRFHFNTNSPIQLGVPVLPVGIEKSDPILGKHQIFEKHVTITLPLLSGGNTLNLRVTYQGCSANGFCYPPTTKLINLDLTKNFKQIQSGITVPGFSTPIENSATHNPITKLFQQNLFWLLLGFLGFGLLLSFTPCVLPMIPILSGIIIGHGKNITTYKAFILSFTYVLSMAFTYSIAGVAAGYLGNTIQASLQSPWVIGIFSLVFVLLALSLFGFYELQLPYWLRQRLNDFSQRWQGGSLVSVAIMGCLSTLIVSPCVTPPLVGALSYISHTGNAWLGGLALFTMGIGMGLPLLVIGIFGGKFLPQVGSWMNSIKTFFGILMLGVAIWMLQRILPAPLILVLWAILLIILAIYMGAFDPQPSQLRHRFLKGFGLVFFIYAIILIIGAAMGNTNPLQPLEKLRFNQTTMKTSTPLNFQLIKTQEDLNKALLTAQLQHKPVMLDFYANWCIACQELEHETFTVPAVQNALRQFILLKADVTANDAIDQALQKSLGVIAPPTLIFFDRQAKEIAEFRLVGEIGPADFIAHLQEMGKTIQ